MYIYKITNLIDGKIYIGKKTDLSENSEDYLGSGKLITRAVNLHGVSNFIKEILEKDLPDLKSLNEREIYWISHILIDQKVIILPKVEMVEILFLINPKRIKPPGEKVLL